jgi:hypothetical protein
MDGFFYMQFWVLDSDTNHLTKNLTVHVNDRHTAN